MKWVYYIKSNLYGDNAQGNVLGIHSAEQTAREHFASCVACRRERGESTTMHGPETPLRPWWDWVMLSTTVESVAPSTRWESLELIRTALICESNRREIKRLEQARKRSHA